MTREQIDDYMMLEDKVYYIERYCSDRAYCNKCPTKILNDKGYCIVISLSRLDPRKYRNEINTAFDRMKEKNKSVKKPDDELRAKVEALIGECENRTCYKCKIAILNDARMCITYFLRSWDPEDIEDEINDAYARMTKHSKSEPTISDN